MPHLTIHRDDLTFSYFSFVGERRVDEEGSNKSQQPYARIGLLSLWDLSYL